MTSVEIVVLISVQVSASSKLVNAGCHPYRIKGEFGENWPGFGIFFFLAMNTEHILLKQP